MSKTQNLSTQEALQQVYQTALRQELMNAMRQEHEFERFKTIGEETTRRLQQEENDFQADYPRRHAEAQQVILREAHGTLLDASQPDGQKRHSLSQDNIAKVPNKEALDSQAKNRVMRDHKARIAAIQKDEINQYLKLKATVKARETSKGRAQEHFQQAHHSTTELTKRRSGPDR